METVSKNNNPHSFQFEVSAFLSAARSVLQYMNKEVNGTTGQKWYDDTVAKSSVFRFFKDRRDVNIHAEPLALSLKVDTFDIVSISLSESVNVVKRDSDGNVIEVIMTQNTNDLGLTEPSGRSVAYRYSFPDWVGKEDVLQSAEKYVTELRNFVKEG